MIQGERTFEDPGPTLPKLLYVLGGFHLGLVNAYWLGAFRGLSSETFGDVAPWVVAIFLASLGLVGASRLRASGTGVGASRMPRALSLSLDAAGLLLLLFVFAYGYWGGDTQRLTRYFVRFAPFLVVAGLLMARLLWRAFGKPPRS